jgi:NADH-quinone oxidoreductase subunit N
MSSINGIFLYSIAYSIASIIAFGALILVQAQSNSETFDSFNGLAKKNPFLAITLTVAMLSLAGIPLTAGFIGKFMMFSAALSNHYIWLVVIAVVNAVIGIAYYFRVIIAMYMNDSDDSEITVPAYFKLVLGLGVFATIILGVYPALIPNLFL